MCRSRPELIEHEPLLAALVDFGPEHGHKGLDFRPSSTHKNSDLDNQTNTTWSDDVERFATRKQQTSLIAALPVRQGRGSDIPSSTPQRGPHVAGAGTTGPDTTCPFRRSRALQKLSAAHVRRAPPARARNPPALPRARQLGRPHVLPQRMGQTMGTSQSIGSKGSP